MRYLLVDRVTAWEAGRFMEGVKNVTLSEDFLQYHFPRFPVMPGSLLIEALAQLAGWLEGAGTDFKTWLLLERVRSVRYYGFALPGDQVALRVEAAGEEEGLRLFKGMAMVEGERRAVVDFAARAVELADYEDPGEQRAHFRVLRREAPFSEAMQ
ncbi:MAG: beta-hydroxyacyl-ACP dehydratase [Candidatus Tectomicrobia bacterium]|nr:beta-hydroxyacyl-ACP dehydratase [Candidatus Tectomicrobia bacterium]MBI3026206.1 beta-hydroxyacyl-ACP dehydratase [Candidatus Tectomicrobia bacterium]